VNKDSIGSGLLYGGDSQTLCDLKRRGRSSPFKVHARPDLDIKFTPKFYYIKRRFSITSKYRHIYGVLNIDEIKN
jgi:hypothetical protein